MTDKGIKGTTDKGTTDKEQIQDIIKKRLNIKHLVLSGGGPSLMQTLGAIQELDDVIDLNSIQSIYGTSAGAILGVMLCLRFDWATLNDYILLRPWHEAFPVKLHNILDAYSKRGMFDRNAIVKCLKPLFSAKDVSLDITLEGFYKLNQVELHMFAFDVNGYKLDDLSHITCPDMLLVDALHATSAIPILFCPVFIGEKCYVDGGITTNYPLGPCLDSGKLEDEVLGFKNEYDNVGYLITAESTLVEYMLNFFLNIIRHMGVSHLQPTIKYEVVSKAQCMNLNVINLAISSVEERKRLFDLGRENGKQFCASIL